MSTNSPPNRPSKTNRADPAGDEVARFFGTRLRAARGRRTLRDLSMESGVSIAYISDLERGNLKNPSLATLSKIAGALGVSVDDLLGDPSPQSRPPVRPTPKALAAFVESGPFRAAIADTAKRWKVAEGTLEADWIRLLSAIEVAGRRPETESDWHFVFETVRRTVDR